MSTEHTKPSAGLRAALDGETVDLTIDDAAESVRCSPAPFSDRTVPPPGAPAPTSALVDEGEIARGGMGAVHRVFHSRLLRREAMKRLERPDPGSRLSHRFLEEAQITGQLDHPNVVPVYDLALDDEGNPSFFTMKLVQGKTLRQVFDEQGDERLAGRTLERLLQIVLRVCDAISFAHSRGVIHCDLKPDNVMVGSHGQVYVMDWGLALLRSGARPSEAEVDRVAVSAHAEGATEHPEGVVGTPAYMAPEQAWARVRDIDERTDVYALGGILYRMLTGKPPHAAPTVAGAVGRAREGKVTPPKAEGGDAFPPELCRIAMKALEGRAADRYPTVTELQRDLEAFLRGGGWLGTARFVAGAMIVKEGDAGNAAYIVVEGRCEAFKEANGKRTSLRVMGPGEVFGETAVLTDRPRTASVVALDDVTVKVVTREALEMELAQNRWLGAFVRALAERFRELDALRGT